MRIVGHLLRKEFLQIFRNKGMLPIIFIAPLVQLLVLVHAADFEVRNVRLLVNDMDGSTASRGIVERFRASDRFRVDGTHAGFTGGMAALDDGRADAFLRIPAGFEAALYRGERAPLMLDLNGVDGQFASLVLVYARTIIADEQVHVVQRMHGLDRPPAPPVDVVPRFWYNLRMNYKNLMVPGLLVVLVTLAGMFLSSMNIVREKEIGTIEQINVTPIKKWQFILGKLLPFWFISLFLLAFGLTVGRLVFHIPIEGSVFLLFAFAGVYLWVMLGLGLLISTVSDTQQQSMFLSWFFLVIFVLLSGLFTPIDNMPHWAQRITWFNPVSYFVEVVRMVLLKGSGFMDMARHFVVIGIFAVVVNGLAVLNYRKRA
ncbi:MAG: ABC transporter permease [Flavobacteriales bacterium]|nr:MAG: ABC transporter permease [Flavobacteriales bacterium]